MSVIHANGSESIAARPLTLITPGYLEQNRLLHEQEAAYGVSGARWGRYIERLVAQEKYATILDYGCGKGTLAKTLPHLTVAEYDPAIAGKDARPEPAELVICTDVLEHIEPDLLHNVLSDLRLLTQKKLFFNIALRKAKKSLPDGRNAHLLVMPATWWFEQMKEHFTITLWEVREGLVYGEAYPGGGVDGVIRKSRYVRRNREQRRKVEREMQGIVDMVKAASRKYSDALSYIHTAEQWEPWDNVTADLLVCGNVLNQLDATVGPAGSELQRAMTMLCQQARIGLVLVVPLDAIRGEEWWKEFLGRYLLFSDWLVARGCVYCVGGPVTKVQGVKAIMATSDDALWEQTKANIARIKMRISPCAPHGRRAIVACYGPSLGDYLPKMIEEKETEPGSVIVSVSGAHDFLIDRGIIPDFHVECDPRPHKADNIARGHPDVRYLMASVVHGDVFNKLEGCDVSLWHVAMQQFAVKLVDELGEKGATIISGGGSVGLRSMPLLYALGFRDFSMYAMDCSFADDGRQQWAGKHAGKRQDVTTCSVGERVFFTSPVLMTYAANFMDEMRKMSDCGFRVWGDGLLPAMVARHFGLEYQEYPQSESTGSI